MDGCWDVGEGGIPGVARYVARYLGISWSGGCTLQYCFILDRIFDLMQGSDMVTFFWKFEL